MMKNYSVKELIEAFIDGAELGQASGGRLYIQNGNRLMHYRTCLAEATAGTWYLNMTKYSPTTSKHQNIIKAELLSRRCFPVFLENVKIETGTLSTLAN